ncbi:hypothetical protein ACH41H_13635 [Streptomyces sp. NPDC020800]|uniref:hypothetical protein n=1 Tax=Streptomyces sp. NPDC020800 TaxID=3365092 RepID=UPI0037A435FF
MKREPEQTPLRLDPALSAFVYCAVLIAGVVLIVTGRANPVEASGFTSPFLVIFEGVKGR